MSKDQYQLVSDKGLTLINPLKSLEDNICFLRDADCWQDILGYVLQHKGWRQVMSYMLTQVSPDNELENGIYHNISAWLTEEDESLRWNIFKQANELGISSPLSLMGMSLFMSSGSLSPEENSPVYPDPALSSFILRGAMLCFVELHAEAQMPNEFCWQLAYPLVN